MKAKEEAKQKTKEKIQGAMARPAVELANSGASIERPAVPVAKEKESDNQVMEEIPIAGRTKMTVPKKDIQEVSTPDSGSDSQESEETVDHLDAKAELNAILKRSPGTLHPQRLRNIYDPREGTLISWDKEN